MTSKLIRKVAVVYNPEKERALQEWRALRGWLRQRKHSVIGSTRVTSAMKTADFIIALGGDGTVLSVARSVADWGLPVLGINVGRLGFLAATDGGDSYRTLTRVLAGEGRVESRTALEVLIFSQGRKKGPFFALNDCVIRSGATGRVLTVEASVRRQVLATYTGDGLIVATPTGSTAYNLAASGPIVFPDLDVLLLTPICPHTLAQRPLVLPSYEVVSMRMSRPGPQAVVALDGKLTHTLKMGDRIEVRRGATPVKLLMDPERNFYQVLQGKLKWGG